MQTDCPNGNIVTVIIYLRKVEGKIHYGFVTNCQPKFRDRMRQIALELVKEESYYFEDHKPSRVFYNAYDILILKNNIDNYPKTGVLTRFKDREVDYDIPNLLESKSLNFSKKMKNFVTKMISAQDNEEVDPDSRAAFLVNTTPMLVVEQYNSPESINNNSLINEFDDAVSKKGLSRSLLDASSKKESREYNNIVKAERLCSQYGIKSKEVLEKLIWMLSRGWVNANQIKTITDDYLLLKQPVFHGVIGDSFNGYQKFGKYFHKGVCTINRLTVESFKKLYGTDY
jgi:hypothetical protein